MRPESGRARPAARMPRHTSASTAPPRTRHQPRHLPRAKRERSRGGGGDGAPEKAGRQDAHGEPREQDVLDALFANGGQA